MPTLRFSNASTCLYAEEPDLAPTEEEVSVALTVIVDCLSASLVTSCTDTDIVLPCSNVQMNSSSGLPRRIAYFLADPSEYVKALAPSDSAGGFFASLLSLVNNTARNPLVSAAYLAMSTRGYTQGGYLLSGSITFSYPDGVTLEDVLELWTTRESTGDRGITMVVEMQVYGSNLSRPLSVGGRFRMLVNEDSDIVINSVGVYNINGLAYQGGEFRL